MSSILIAGSVPVAVIEELEALGYGVVSFSDLKGFIATKVLTVLAADYLVVFGNTLTPEATMAVGAALVTGCKIVVIGPTSEALDMIQPAIAGYVGSSMGVAVREYFSKLVNARFEARSRNVNRREK